MKSSPKESKTPFYFQCLKDALSLRCQKNPSYSLRAFARALRLDPTALSRILSGKQVPSLKVAHQCIQVLELGPEQSRKFLLSLAKSQAQRNLRRRPPRGFSDLADLYIQSPSDLVVTPLDNESYQVIAEWFHAAILELTFSDDFKSNAKWVASQLGISPITAKLAIDRMLDLRLLKKGPRGQLLKTHKQLDTVDRHLSSPALRKGQKQFLEKAIESVENDSIDERDMSFMVMNIDPSKIPEAKKMIVHFRQVLCKYLESGKRGRVYNLQISLYPLQKKFSKPGVKK